VGVTGTGTAVALRVAVVVRVHDVSGDLPDPVAGNNKNYVNSRSGGSRRYERSTYPG
jgi:hypothetical protein